MPMQQLNAASTPQAMREKAALQRLRTPDQIAKVALFLLSDLGRRASGAATSAT
jgi:enoyl-[acyl-carrier-protein] reductase (NADH)